MKDIIQLYNSSKKEQVLMATIYSIVAEGLGFMGGISPNKQLIETIISIRVPPHLRVYTSLESFLAKYLVYLLRIIIPFTSRSVAALLNISRETGSNVSSTEVDLGFEGLLDGPPGSPACGCLMDLDSGIGVVCNPVIEVDGGRRVSLSTAAWCGVADVVCGSAVDCASSDNMGNNESKDGVLPVREATSFTRFPTVEEERVTLLLYHMSINP